VPVQLERGGAWGYASTNGELAIAPRFRNAFPFGGGRAIVVEAQGPGIIDASGDVVTRFTLGEPLRDATAFGKSGLASVDAEGLALLARDGRVVIPLHLLSGIYGLDEPMVWVKYAALD
jgi:hypothetical protein